MLVTPGDIYRTIRSGISFLVHEVHGVECLIRALDGQPQELVVPQQWVLEHFNYVGRIN